ncbi:hypothetical protein B0T17DRAFT_526165 [Bombardia bombarda]|uniref:Transmembrane protein 42 n=1 Tax=Bombardia bombarda TaxID=252184 RepID=A0AA39X9A2_9PEZI|nr:hypothetical protein B0T17DRAFT_526165 [Bombardia bombarda]
MPGRRRNDDHPPSRGVANAVVTGTPSSPSSTLGSPSTTGVSSEIADAAAARSTATASTHLPGHIKKRLPRPSGGRRAEMDGAQDDQQPLLNGQTAVESDNPDTADSNSNMAAATWTSRNEWIVFALASGACAAFNGVFAKLTTTDLTTNISQGIARFLNLSSIENSIEVVIRSIFFGLNLVFNGIMWTFFTKALARGNSTTQVSIMNTSSNFFITAILGFAIFSEALPPLWWLGAAMLVAGNVIIGRKDEGTVVDAAAAAAVIPPASAASLAEDGLGSFQPIPMDDGPARTSLPIEGKNDDVLDLDLGEESQ